MVKSAQTRFKTTSSKNYSINFFSLLPFPFFQYSFQSGPQPLELRCLVVAAGVRRRVPAAGGASAEEDDGG